MIDKWRCYKEFIWNSSICKFECDWSCDVGEYLKYKNFDCTKDFFSKLVKECREYINGNKMIYNTTLNDYKKVYSSCIVYILLFETVFLIMIGISSA